jgi:hypothetical protein
LASTIELAESGAKAGAELDCKDSTSLLPSGVSVSVESSVTHSGETIAELLKASSGVRGKPPRPVIINSSEVLLALQRRVTIWGVSLVSRTLIDLPVLICGRSLGGGKSWEKELSYCVVRNVPPIVSEAFCPEMKPLKLLRTRLA